MRYLNEGRFLAKLKGLRIELDERYSQSASLTFVSRPEIDRFWAVPPEPERRPALIQSILELIGEWDSCYAWRHLGGWPGGADRSRINDVVEYQILKGLGLALGTNEIVEFDRSEIDELTTLLFSTTIFGWSVEEDLYIVPSHGRYIAKTDHHSVIHVSFRTQRDCDEFVAEMETYGFSLPDKPPDATFGTPKWMSGAERPGG